MFYIQTLISTGSLHCPFPRTLAKERTGIWSLMGPYWVCLFLLYEQITSSCVHIKAAFFLFLEHHLLLSSPAVVDQLPWAIMVLSLIQAKDFCTNNFCFLWVSVVSACDSCPSCAHKPIFSGIVLEHECYPSAQLSHLGSTE